MQTCQDFVDQTGCLTGNGFGQTPKHLGQLVEAFRLRSGTDRDADVTDELRASSQRIPFNDIELYGKRQPAHLIEDCSEPRMIRVRGAFED